MSEPLIELRDIHKSFGDTKVLSGISLKVCRGEFITLLGASGCGKTTTLRIIAGLARPDSGSVILNGEDVTSLPPEKRPVNTVFQNYALFPHMNVEKNIAYGMRIKGAKKSEWKARVRDLLELVQLSGFEKRMPHELSGGQRQRIAIARAVIMQPKLLLLDEPLGALDLKLRREMQTELKEIQKRLGIAFIYITHDQEEALNMSDRIAVMHKGAFDQIGTPEEIYERPLTRYTATFIGQAVLFEGRIAQDVSACLLTCGVSALPGGEYAPGERVTLSVHPERIRFSSSPVSGFDIPAVIRGHRYAGSMIKTELLLLKDNRVIGIEGAHAMADLPAPGTNVFVYWDEKRQSVLREADA